MLYVYIYMRCTNFYINRGVSMKKMITSSSTRSTPSPTPLVLLGKTARTGDPNSQNHIYELVLVLSCLPYFLLWYNFKLVTSYSLGASDRGRR
jgi:hypothetical protein